MKKVQADESVDALVVKLLEQLRSVDEFAYSEQVTLPGALSGCCAKGIVPRDEPDACKVCTVDAATPAAALVDAAKTFDVILQKCDS